MIRDQFGLSFKNLSRRRLRSWLTMIGIVIGIASVVALISLGEGLRFAITSQFGFLGANFIQVRIGVVNGPPGTTTVANPLTKDDVRHINAVQGVDRAAGRLIRSVKSEFNRKASITFLATMPNSPERSLIEEVGNYEAASGRLLRDGDTNSVMVGSTYADKDTFGKVIVPGTKITLEGKQFTVVGILKKKGSFIIDNNVLVNEQVGRDLLGINSDSYDAIGVRVQDVNTIDKVRDDIARLLRKTRDVKEGEEDFTVETSQTTIQNLGDILLSVNIFVWVIAGISLLVGGIGIMNTMYTSVVERTKEIGIMKSIGAKNSAIFSLFFIESGLLGSAGGAIGILFGVAFASLVASIGRIALGSDLISAHFSPWLLIGALLFSFVLGVGFGILPAYRAAQLSPVDAIRKTI